MFKEFSIPINVAELPPTGLLIRETIKKDVRLGIASRLAVDAIDTFLIDISVKRDGGPQSGLLVSGMIKATVIQSCSVTLEPIRSDFSIPVMITFKEKNEHDQTPIDMDVDEIDPPEYIVNGRADIGDILTQLLAMEINPFPRKSGSRLADISVSGVKLHGDSGEPDTDHPFAALAELRDKLRAR